MKIAILYRDEIGFPVTGKHVEMIRKVFPDADIRKVRDESELESEGFKADILLCWATGGGLCIAGNYCRYDDALKWVFSLSAGVEGIVPVLKDLSNVCLTNTKGIHGIPISETVMGYLLSTFRGLPQVKENQRRHRWQRFVGEETCGRTVSIIGIGAIGQTIASRCKAFGMYVIGVKRQVTKIPNVDEVMPVERLDDALERADIVIVTLPASAQTEKLINADRFSKMKRSALFVNCGRGSTVDTQAMTAALAEGRLAGAFLDALDPEPLPPDSPLWDMENVVISPHISAQSAAYMDRAFEVFQNQAVTYLNDGSISGETEVR